MPGSGNRGTCQAGSPQLKPLCRCERWGPAAKGTLGGPHTSPDHAHTHNTSWQFARCTHKATRLHVRSKLRPPHDFNLGLLAFMMRCLPDTQPPYRNDLRNSSVAACGLLAGQWLSNYSTTLWSFAARQVDTSPLPRRGPHGISPHAPSQRRALALLWYLCPRADDGRTPFPLSSWSSSSS